MRIHKLARLVYTMLTKGEEYTDKGHDYDEERYRERVLRHLAKRALARHAGHFMPGRRTSACVSR